MKFANLGDVTNWGIKTLSWGAKWSRFGGIACAAIAAGALVVPVTGNAQETKDNNEAAAPQATAQTPQKPPAESAKVSVELNKLEKVERGCRAYVVVVNSGDKPYQSYKLDLVLFQTDGIIGRRFAVDLAPLKPKKRVVKLFDLDGMACDGIGSLLVNDVLECKSDAGDDSECLAGMSVSSLVPNVQLSK